MYPENSEEQNLVERRPDGESNLDLSEGSRGQAMELSYDGRISEVEELFSRSSQLKWDMRDAARRQRRS